MTFTSTITDGPLVKGSEKEVRGTYVNDSGSTGGEVETGLLQIKSLRLQPIGTAVIATQSVVNESFPINASAATIVTSADESGIWIATGK